MKLPGLPVRPLCYLWALPTTCLGLLFVLIAWLNRGNIALIDGVIEVHSALIARFLEKAAPRPGGVAAMTLGHVIIGRNADCLHHCRAHERVHVRQCERWGPFFIPAYLLASLIAYGRGLDPYLDNSFEREAFRSD